ncbi:MAG: carbon-nitrogen hydrolase family protein [Gammaproteobacteria bacterium]|nr:carbon-nitrogen hydrolase family protein [Gammaproteobacteria bacterium]
MSKVAAIQMASAPQRDANLMEASRLIQLAKEQGAELIVLPENFPIMGIEESDKVDIREAYNDGPIQNFLSDQAKKHGVWIVGGTVPLQYDDPNKIIAACIVYNSEGKAVARYDKIHLFDVEIDGEESYKESETIANGTELVVLDTPFGKLGLAICYDLRFPELFRQLVDMGAEIIAIPSAFTATTGKSHWEILVRARAIENLCYVIAADQGGYHLSGRSTYGDSMVVDPWGNVLNRLSQGAGVVIAEIDLERMKNTRRTFPCLQHRMLK